MRAVAAGTLALDAPLARYVPEFVAGAAGPDRESVTVRRLLSHASGLPAHRRFYERVAHAPSARFAIALGAAHEPLGYSPGSRSVYSDLGFILLGWLLERAAGARLDVQAHAAVFAPLGLASTTFVNLADSEARAHLLSTHSVAATERCPVRGRVVLGEVHDLNAYAMGGIAGHAGLFSTAADLGRIAGALGAAWRGDAAPSAPSAPHATGQAAVPAAAGAAIVERDVVREFWRPAGVPGSTWRLGWDGPAPGGRGSQAGERLSRAAVGHLGYTGCSLWIDPERARWIVVLTNRVHPAVENDGRFPAFRPALNDALVAALD